MKEDVLPEGWVKLKLSDVCIKGTQRKPTNDEEFYYIDISSIDRNLKKISTPEKVLGVNAPSRARKIIHQGDVLVSLTRPNLNAVALITKQYDNQIASTGFEVLKPTKIQSELLYFLVRTQHFINAISSLEQGALYPAAKSSDVQNYQFNLPPLPEQQYLSQKLTALLDEVAQTKQRLEAIPALLKQFRQSVLADAVSGRLTEEWRGSSSYDEDGYPIDWDKKKLSDLGVLNRGKSKHRPRNDPQLFGIEYPFIQTGDVANSNGEIWNSRQFYSQFGLAQSKLFPKDTLCITIAANIADTSILRIDACFPDSIVGFISNDNNNVLFIKYLIDVNKNNLERFAPATAQKNINLKILNELVFSVPPKEEQTQIVQKVETYFALADEIETQVNAALENVNLLTQSILAKAFSGELSATWRNSQVRETQGKV
jgi:specificity determinant for hsdM and hsdR